MTEITDAQFAMEACFSTGSYKSLLPGEDIRRTARILHGASFALDVYCTRCRRETPFRRSVLGKGPKRLSDIQAPIEGIKNVDIELEIVAVCARCHGKYRFVFGGYKGGIAKIGQSPSMADIARGTVSRYVTLLEDVDLEELGKADLLFDHGMAVGAYVYLRRIFERLIRRHHEGRAEPVEGFESLPIEQKVKALAEVLPAPIVKRWKVYSVLSAGIHALSEDDASRFFRVLRTTIVDILENDVAARDREAADRRLDVELGAVLQDMNTEDLK